MIFVFGYNDVLISHRHTHRPDLSAVCEGERALLEGNRMLLSNGDCDEWLSVTMKERSYSAGKGGRGGSKERKKGWQGRGIDGILTLLASWVQWL